MLSISSPTNDDVITSNCSKSEAVTPSPELAGPPLKDTVEDVLAESHVEENAEDKITPVVESLLAELPKEVRVSSWVL